MFPGHLLFLACSHKIIKQCNSIEMRSNFITGSISLPEPFSIFGWIPFCRNPPEPCVAISSLSPVVDHIALAKKPSTGSYSLQPDHGIERFNGLPAGCFITLYCIFIAHCSKVCCSIPTVIITYFPYPFIIFPV